MLLPKPSFKIIAFLIVVTVVIISASVLIHKKSKNKEVVKIKNEAIINSKYSIVKAAGVTYILIPNTNGSWKVINATADSLKIKRK